MTAPSPRDAGAPITKEPQTRAVGASPPYSMLPNWLFDGRATAYELVVLMALQSYGRRIFPSVERLARRADISPRKTRLVLRDLESKGYIERRHGFRSDGSQTSNTYRVTVFDQKWSNMARKEEEEAGDPWDQVFMREGVHHVQPGASNLKSGTTCRGGLHESTGGGGTTCSLRRLKEPDKENNKPKTQEPPSKAPQGAVLPSVAHRGGPDVDGWMGGQPTTTRPLQQPQEAASTASSGSPYRQAPQDGLPGPQSSQFQPEAPAEQPKPRAKAPAKPRDPYASRVLPESAVPDDLLGVQQLLREWWGLKPRGRTEAAFNRACSLLRRYSRSEQEQILEKAVIGGHQGLYEPASASRPGLRSGGGGKPTLTQELRSMGLIQ